ncbi:histidine phosphatase family protein [Pseudorhodoferax soli]|uniref:histidine phosphatase family protein n=1 Tax=Pseudorhodoferax soli TaxID=545864 RepID=UPI0011C057A1|nr:histidine phosphatase family protein [Pseudorhodoferax soli]
MPLEHLLMIRHAERPGSRQAGARPDGTACEHSLSVAGWQRAGALVPYFRCPQAFNAALARPSLLFACRATATAPSLRSVQTLHALAVALGLQVDDTFEKQDEARLADFLAQASGTALVAWSHHGLPGLARAFLRGSAAAAQVPSAWPEHRFDLIWLVDGPAEQRRFSVLPQLLMPGDREVEDG